MSKGIPILILAMIGLTAGVTWSSFAGMGVPNPVKKPISIREGSARHPRHGRRRARYFVGGSHRHGK